jgi:DNA repair protein RadC
MESERRRFAETECTAQPVHIATSFPSPVDSLGESIRDLQRAVDVLSTRYAEIPAIVRVAESISPITAEDAALEIAQMLLTFRSKIEQTFGIGLLSQPVWGILLELYVAKAQDCDVTVGNSCIASSLPMTSALRLCQLLHDHGIVFRERDASDGRRVLLRLSDGAYRSLTKLFLSSDTKGRFTGIR